MKYVKLFEEYLNESVEQKLLTDPIKIKEWIDSWDYDVVHTYVSKNDEDKKLPRLNGTYTIRPDGVVDVVGSVNLSDKELINIPVQFGKVTEDFYCKNNYLISLKGCPTSVGGSFNCSGNRNLTSLLYCPSTIGINFHCYGNNLTSLLYCPISVPGVFDCSRNVQLTTLEYCPTSVGGIFWGHNNPNLITNEVESKVIGNVVTSDIEGTLEERTEWYLYYLENYCPDVEYSLSWLKRVDEELFNQMLPNLVDYIVKNNIPNILSDRVMNVNKNISTRQNKRMPLL